MTKNEDLGGKGSQHLICSSTLYKTLGHDHKVITT